MNFIDCCRLMDASGGSAAMVERRHTGVTRHSGGWIVLATGLLGACLWGAWITRSFSSRFDRPLADTRLKHFPELRIDINQADEAELSCVAGIGPTLAHRIVEYRQRVGQFRTMAELERVPGVGPQLARQLRTAIQPLPENEYDFAQANPARLAGRQIPSPINEPLND